MNLLWVSFTNILSEFSVGNNPWNESERNSPVIFWNYSWNNFLKVIPVGIALRWKYMKLLLERTLKQYNYDLKKIEGRLKKKLLNSFIIEFLNFLLLRIFCRKGNWNHLWRALFKPTIPPYDIFCSSFYMFLSLAQCSTNDLP